MTVQRKRLDAHSFRKLVFHFVGDHVEHQIIGVTGIANTVALIRLILPVPYLILHVYVALIYYSIYHL